MLAQELHADVHQLHRIQGRTAQMRRARGVRGHAVEVKLLLDAGHAGAAGDLVYIGRMPGDGRVQVLPHMIARQKRLARAALLAGTAKKDDRALLLRVLLQIRLDREGRRQRARTQQVMPAAMAAAARNQRGVMRAGCLLRQAGQRVKLAQNANYRMAMAPAAAEGRLDAAHVGGDGKAVFSKHLFIQGGGLKFLQRQLGIFPYLAAYIAKQRGMIVNCLDGGFLRIVHGGSP